jgi:hypothetical protein
MHLVTQFGSFNLQSWDSIGSPSMICARSEVRFTEIQLLQAEMMLSDVADIFPLVAF